MTKEEQEALLAEARIIYRGVTKIRSAIKGGNTCSSVGVGKYDYAEGTGDIIWNILYGNSRGGWLYCNGKWADIIERGEIYYEIY